MELHFDFHPDIFLILPHCSVYRGQCHEDCPELHWKISLGWIVGSIHIVL